MENQQENRLEGISLFAEIRDTRKISDMKFKQIDKALTYCLDEDESEIIKKKYLSNLDFFGTVSLLVEFQERLGIEVSISDFDRDQWTTPNMIIKKLEAMR